MRVEGEEEERGAHTSMRREGGASVNKQVNTRTEYTSASRGQHKQTKKRAEKAGGCASANAQKKCSGTINQDLQKTLHIWILND